MADKHIVVQGATCQCKFSEAPQTDVLKVLTQSKVTINDKEGKDKLVATDKDIGQTLEKNTFGNCTLQPTSSGNLPCQVIINKWNGAYDKLIIEENGGHYLLEDSKATCPIGGPDCIEIKNHGQTGEGNHQQVRQGDNNAQNQANPVFKDFMDSQAQKKAETFVGPQEQREILKIDMYDINDDPIPKGELFHYGKKVITTVHTAGMVGEMLHIELWEDDAIGAGHSEENRYNKVAEQLATVGEAGIAQVQFVIQNAYRKIATAHNAYEGKTHEYYVTAYAPDTPLIAGGNINIYAPEYKEEKKKIIIDKIKGIEPVGVQEPKQKIKAEAPKEVVPPQKPAPTKPAPKPAVPKAVEPKKITYIYFTDDKNHKITQASYNGMKIRAHFGSTGLINQKVIMRMYDHEAMGENNFLDATPEFTIKESPCFVSFVLNEKVKERGANLYSDNVFVEIEIMETKAHVVSTQIKVNTNNSIIDIARNITKGKVGKTDVKDEKKSDCPNCDKPVTADELKKIFTGADDATLTKVAETYSKYMKELGMNTCWNKAHLFSQARVEAGRTLNLKEGEGFNYYYKSLSLFGAFQTKEGKEKAKLWGRPEIKPKLPGVSQENQKNIANWAYSPPARMAKELGNTNANDGWDYRGRGLIQVTGKAFYEYCNKFTLKNNMDVVANPNLIGEKVELSVLSAMIFFKWKNINTLTKGNKDVIGSICPKVGNDAPIKDENGNSSTNHKEKQKIFDEITSKVFNINNCRINTEKEKTEIGLQTHDGVYKATDSEYYIDIIVPADRTKEGLLVFFDNKEILFKCYVLAMGTTNNAIMIPEGHGSTPKGLWSSWHEEVHIGDKSYGDHGLIKMNGIKGDASTAMKKGRKGIAIHSGHTMDNPKGVYNDTGALMYTYGCVRVYNASMKTLVSLYKSKKAGNKKINVYVEEVSDISKVFEKYSVLADSKDYKRKYSKIGKQ